MTDNKPRFKFEVNLRLSRIGDKLAVQDPALITDAILDQAWNTMNAFVMDLLDEKGVDVDDEQFREVLIEICYRIIYREMFTLFVMPGWEESWKERLGTRKTGGRVHKKGSYDDTWNQ
jgi:hypothetical protein